MARATETRKPQIAEALCARIDRLRTQFGPMSFNAMTELLLGQMLDLIEQPAATRRVPPIALALDAMGESVPLSSRPAPVALADAAAKEALSFAKKGKK